MLTHLQVKNALPKDKMYNLSDGNGVYLRVRPNGAKSWIGCFRSNGNKTCLKVGDYPELTIKEAREQLSLLKA